MVSGFVLTGKMCDVLAFLQVLVELERDMPHLLTELDGEVIRVSEV